MLHSPVLNPEEVIVRRIEVEAVKISRCLSVSQSGLNHSVQLVKGMVGEDIFYSIEMIEAQLFTTRLAKILQNFETHFTLLGGVTGGLKDMR